MGEPCSVLLVEAQKSIVDRIRELLEGDPSNRFSLLHVTSLARALDTLEASPVAVVLVDLDLPDTQGLDPFLSIRQNASFVPIVAFAESFEAARALDVIRAGAEDVLSLDQVLSPQLARALEFATERNALRNAKIARAEQLQFSEARFRLLTNENPDAILVLSPEGIIRFANPAAAALMGKERQELTGMLFDRTELIDGKVFSIARATGPVSVKMRMVETIWHGENVFIVTLLDVTAQTVEIELLHANVERYQTFIGASLEGIWRTDLQNPVSIILPVEEQVESLLGETIISDANDAMAQMYGYAAAGEIIGTQVMMEPAPAREYNRELYRAFVRNGYRLTEALSYELDRYGNSKVFLNNFYGVVRDNLLVGMWGTQRDVTLAEKTRQDLAQAQATGLHQREMAQALADSAVALNSTLRYEQVLDRILENVGRVVPHDAASIFLLREGLAYLVRGHGFAERQLQEWVENLRLSVREIPGFLAILKSGKPLLIPDTSKDPGWIDLTNGWVKSYLGAPLRVQNETIGFLNLDSTIADFYTMQHAEDLEAFAAQAATALENARLHAQVQQRAQEFAVLYDLTHELGMQRDLDALLEMLVERAVKLLNAAGGALALYLPDARQLEPRVIRGGSQTPQPPRLNLGEGLFGRVALLQQTIVVQNYRTWEHRTERLGGSRVSAVVGVPMLFGGELVGVLAVHEEGETTRRFSSDDVQLLTLLAAQAAALVHNARLHQETEKRAGQMALLYDAGLTLNSVLDPATQLDFLTRIAMRSVRAELAAFFRYDQATRELVLAFGLGYSEALPYKYKQRVSLDSEQGIEAHAARERMPINLPDVHADPRFAQSDEHLVSGVWVPIEHDNRLLGVLAVGSTRLRGFDAHDERLLQLYASQAAVALENARLYQEAIQDNERRTVLHRASQEIVSAGLDAERVYAAIHMAASRLMSCEAFVIAVLDESGEWINLAYATDRQGRQPGGRIHKSRGLSGYVLAHGETLLIDNIAESDVEAINLRNVVQVVSVLAVPLRHGGQVFGMLSVQSYRQKAYSEDDRVFLEMLAAHAAAALMNVRGAELRLQELERANLETALALAKAIDARDTYTGAHSDRIAELAAALAQSLNVDAEDAYALRLGARLHDIGKIGVPDDILRKPGELTEQEWALMKLHPVIGAEILALVRPLHRVIPIVKHHQERYDGTGYPDGLAGEEIPLGARILAVVDAYSAMTDDRAYRRGLGPEEALAELERGAGTQFDPKVVEAFLRLEGHVPR